MPLARLSATDWTALAPGCWAMGPQDVGWHSGMAPSATAFLIQDNQDCWLIDCGAGPTRLTLTKRAPASPTRLLLTHAHPDHAALLEHWQELPAWMSHRNPASWNHEEYVRAHWKHYRSLRGLCHGISRSAILQALPELSNDLNAPEAEWEAAVQNAILRAGIVFYGDRPPFERTHDLDQHPLQAVRIGEEEWMGWRLGNLWIFPSRGHSPDQVIAWWPEANLWILADETSAAPVWTDSDQRSTFALQKKVRNSLFGSPLISGGHQAFYVHGLADCSLFLERLLNLGRQLEHACLTSDDFEGVWDAVAEASWMQPFLRGQFPQGLFFAKQFVHNWRLQSSDGLMVQPD
jgi:glyoxylase-like metal-dependent hydrolase (beta-lactamase superfamily II)